MNIQVVSDLHFDSMSSFLISLANFGSYKDIIFVTGNHDYYGYKGAHEKFNLGRSFSI